MKIALAFALVGFGVDNVSGASVHHDEQASALRKGASFLDASSSPDVRSALTAVLGSGHDVHHGRLEAIRIVLNPMWNSLPTNEHGRVDKRTLRYSLHRYFMDQYSLSIVGLEPASVNSEHHEVLLLSERLPSFVKTDKISGFSLDDAVVMAATIERLIADTDHHLLEDALQAHNMANLFSRKTSTGGYDLQTAHEVLEAYMLRWMLGDDPASITAYEQDRSVLLGAIDDWPHISEFLEGQLKKFQYDMVQTNSHEQHWNAFVPRFSVADIDAVVDTVTLNFGRFWATECQRIKQLLVDMDESGSGRVPLSEFYKASINGEWRFSESKDYLRQMGALDTASSWASDKIIIANYIQASSNCVVTAQHYRVCCYNECEAIMRDLEMAIGGPLASPQSLRAVLDEHESGDNAVRRSAVVDAQLEEIARSTQGGLVPLHGRLFAQWLHYAYPHECPFPHKSNTTSVLSPAEFGDAHIAHLTDMVVSADSKHEEVSSNDQDADWLSQWSHEEELLSEATRLHAPWELPRVSGSAILCVGLLSGLIAASRIRGLKQPQSFLPIVDSKTHMC